MSSTLLTKLSHRAHDIKGHSDEITQMSDIQHVSGVIKLKEQALTCNNIFHNPHIHIQQQVPNNM